MLKTQISKLKKVDLRNVWGHEALDFTQWLSLDENLSLLSEEVEISIKSPRTEVSVGRYNVDILAEEENSGRKIIIENQLEDTNHDHLGKIITYASGHDAEIIIWIVKNYREEHQKAIDWLNEHTDKNISFFLIKIELWQIGESDPAPKFDVIARPNEWAKTIKQVGDGSLSQTKIMQLEFWNKFNDYAKNRDSKVLRFRNAQPQHWYDLALGSSDAHISLTMNSKENVIACEIYISNSKSLFGLLEKNKKVIESEIQSKLEWLELLDKKASRIKLSRSVNLDDKNKWEYFFEWLFNQSELFYKVFSKHIKLYKQ